ncbi:MAG TPA: glycosyltransferase family 39 protein [Acidobacteriaceae bacterium]
MTSEHPTPITLRERLCVLIPSAIASLIAIVWSWRHHAFELFGDSEAHIHIARRLFDSHRPGLTQLGSVWLPFPHIIMVPFLLVDSWWRSGFAAVIPSAASYLLGVWGLYRLARKWLSPTGAGVSLLVYAANPNLLYLQTTAMNEPIFLCELIWAVLLLVEWYESIEDDHPATGYLWTAILVDICAVFTRYDGWILAAIAWAVMAVVMQRKGRLFDGQFIAASVVLLAAPATWMTYNAVAFGDWLEFMRGPYSAKAIEIRTSSNMDNPHPGFHNPWIALKYFLKAAEMDAARLGWGETISLGALAGTIWGLAHFRKPLFTFQEGPKAGLALTLLLWLPLPFYAYSVSYGYVPIFIPVWTPFSWYNTRYGMELLAALAFFFGFAIEGLAAWLGSKKLWLRPLVMAVIAILAVVNVTLMLRELPLTYIEGSKNAASRAPYTLQLGEALGRLHAIDPQAVALMDTSTFPNVVAIAGMTYKQTINESDKEYYWAALGDPAGHAQIVLALKDGEIEKAVQAHPQHLRKIASFHPTGKTWDQIPATLYVTDTFPLPAEGLPGLTAAGR